MGFSSTGAIRNDPHESFRLLKKKKKKAVIIKPDKNFCSVFFFFHQNCDGMMDYPYGGDKMLDPYLLL